jgi:pSer/pThr/pTyr-binding forkhead associated (FHA) protein
MVGRLPDCDLVVDDPSVSKHHARITWDSGFGSAVVEDLESSNGTQHNGAPVRGIVTVYDGDELTFGEVRYCYLRTRTLHSRLTSGQFSRA